MVVLAVYIRAFVADCFAGDVNPVLRSAPFNKLNWPNYNFLARKQNNRHLHDIKQEVLEPFSHLWLLREMRETKWVCAVGSPPDVAVGVGGD
jgi:hypothetical protein